MRAVILAGGRGTRLAPYTTVIPKPLLPVGERPILEIVCRQLARAGFTHVTLSLGYMSDYFKTFLAQQRALRRLVHIDFVEETEPTGTAGSLASVPGLDGDFLVMNGDVLTNLDYAGLMRAHQESGAWVTIAAHQRQHKIDLGILELDSAGRVTGYIEKPTVRHTVSMGVYVYGSEALACIQPREHLDFPDLVLRLIAAGRPVRAFANDAFWLDLGRHEDLLEASRVFAARETEFLPREAA
ncbi:MAG TPA: sugar phosphate nucleotidyltransferase [Gemmataceae bacterium]|nr:sugar phosphate nucleotidyltransferase [Gemmataceae bacterium]